MVGHAECYVTYSYDRFVTLAAENQFKNNRIRKLLGLTPKQPTRAVPTELHVGKSILPARLLQRIFIDVAHCMFISI